MTVLTERERNFVRGRMRDWAAFFGYDVDRPEPVEPLVPELAAPLPPDRARAGRAPHGVRGRLDFSEPEPALRDQLFRQLPPAFEEPARLGAAWTP